MKKTLDEIAAIIGGEVEGDGSIVIKGLSGIPEAGPGMLSFIANEKYLPLLQTSRASALVVSRSLVVTGFPLVRVDDPGQAWTELLELVRPEPPEIPEGVHPAAFLGEGVTLGKGTAVMALAALQDGVIVGDGSIIYSGVYVGHDSTIGKDCVIYPNVVIRERIKIGDRVVIQPGAVIGSDGFGYQEDNGRLIKQEQFGTVVLEDDVEIGANVAIDRARFHETRIGRGTKIDNLVQVAHNVTVGSDTVIVSQTGISGSARIGNNVTLAGQCGVAGHITVGDNVIAAGKSALTKNIAPNKIVYGNPAGDRIEKQRQVVGLRRIPDLLKTVRQLKERIARLEAQSEND